MILTSYILYVILYFISLVSCNIDYLTLDYSKPFTGVINNTVEYIYSFNKSNTIDPNSITVTSINASRKYPILVVVRQQRQILSWQIPLLVDTKNGELQFENTSRTLCPDDMAVKYINHTIKSQEDHFIPISKAQITISLSTSSTDNIYFTLKIETETKFHIADNEERHIIVSPSEPKIFFYQFPLLNITNLLDTPDTVLLRIDSDNEICMYISIQNSSCPVYDLEHDIRFEGYWETVSKRGGMNIPRSKFPNGFFIVFVSKSEDYDCLGNINFIPGVINRNKKIKFSIKPGTTRRQYLTAISVTLSLTVASFLFAWIVICLCSKHQNRIPLTMDALDLILDDNNVNSPNEYNSNNPNMNSSNVSNNIGNSSGLGSVTNNIVTPSSTIPDHEFPDEPIIDFMDDNSSLDETEYDTITEAYSERHIYRSKGVLYVSDLAKKPPKILQKKSYLYLWHVITVAVFYGLPVVQLVFTYQKVLADTGNQDLCYYNFLCAHPLGVLSDFNHVLSNIGYIVLGILFIVLVYRRERWHGIDFDFDRQYGIPQHHGLFYAMGAALIMEGILSASYHVCPNHTNFQFDSSFMYVMAVLCMVKIYQNRHPDINATAYATFGVLAVAICLGMIGILAGTVYFWIGFTIAHLLTCLLLTVQIYYMGCWKCDRGMCVRVFRTFVNDFRSGPVNVIKPIYKGRMSLLVIGNVCNWALAIAGLLHHNRDFATYLLAIFMANTLLYTLFYIVMKILHKEKIMFHALTFIFLATFTWAAAMYFFINKSISWALTPAESREFNQPCKLFDFYDPHDIWHFLSAAAMFFSFMILLTLDDDLTHIHRSKIHVF